MVRDLLGGWGKPGQLAKIETEVVPHKAHHTLGMADQTVTLTHRFLISTHYTKYDLVLFGLNFVALVFVLFPKLPIVRAFLRHTNSACLQTPDTSVFICVWQRM
jgi:hypothetical protein